MLSLNISSLNTFRRDKPFEITSPRTGSILPVGQSITFSAAGQDSTAQTTWSFGDGTSATGTMVTHAYEEEGNYTVTASSYQKGAAVSQTITLGIYALPTVTILKPVEAFVQNLEDIRFAAAATNAGCASAMLPPLQNVGVSGWVLQYNADVAGYPYRAAIEYPGVTPEHFASVVFRGEDSASGIYTTICKTDAGVVYVYASQLPTTPLTLETVTAWMGDESMLPPCVDTVVPINGWELQTTPDVAGYPYKADIGYPNVTSDYLAAVVYTQDDSASGIYTTICKTGADVVSIYAAEQPSTPITIPTVIAWTDDIDMLEPLENTEVSSWELQETPDVVGYPYRAEIPYTGITASHYATVVYSQVDSSSGDYTVVCKTAAGKIYIYSKVDATITVPTIAGWMSLGYVIWEFGDGTSATGISVKHQYGYSVSQVTVTATLSNTIGTATDTITLTVVKPMYVWQDAVGNNHSLMDKSKFMVLRSGISGFSDSTAEVVTESHCSNMGEFMKTRSWKRRDGFGFNVVIIGQNHADIENKRRELTAMMSDYDGEGKLILNFDDNSSVYIKAEKARGYPRIQNGLPPKNLARTQEVELRFVSVDPFFYGDEVTAMGVSGFALVENAGDVSTPCEYQISGEQCTNLSTNQTISRRSENHTIDGVVVTSGDAAVTAYNGTINRLNQFALNSVFWKLRPGVNHISGVQYIKYRPRWSGI